MAFINEYIPKEDVDKLNKMFEYRGIAAARSWTIDREKDIWLRKHYTESDHTQPDGGYTGVSFWDYYWKGSLMIVKIKKLESGGGRGQDCWSRKKLLEISLPSELEDKRGSVLESLELALSTYKEGGVLSTSTSYKLTFEL